jgi:hypothetical protein
MMNSISGVRITGNNRLCHARARIVTDEAMTVMGRIPQTAAIGRIPGRPVNCDAASEASVRVFFDKRDFSHGLNRAPVRAFGPNRPQWEI